MVSLSKKSSTLCEARPKALPLESAAFEKAGETFGYGSGGLFESRNVCCILCVFDAAGATFL